MNRNTGLTQRTQEGRNTNSGNEIMRNELKYKQTTQKDREVKM